ncbi:unnamed protein product [Urochloa humidicola]
MAMAAKKVVLLLGLHDNDAREKRKVLKTVSTFPGLDLISMDMKASKLTVVGLVDPIVLVTKLRKLWHADILSVGPASKEEDKAATAAAAGGVKEDDVGGRKRQEVTAELVEIRPAADTRSWPQAVVYPAQHPYPYRPDQYVAGGLGARGENPHDYLYVPGGLGAHEIPRNNNLYVAGGQYGARENRPNSSYVAHGHGARRNHPNSYGGQDPNACAIC